MKKEGIRKQHSEDTLIIPSLNNLADLPNYLAQINRNIINLEKRISKREFDIHSMQDKKYRNKTVEPKPIDKSKDNVFENFNINSSINLNHIKTLVTVT